MALGKKTKVRADAKAPLRLTRLRSQLPGAPHIMQGLDSNNKTTEALPCDPDNIAMAEVRNRLPRAHPMCKPKTRIILHPSQSPSSPPQESREPRNGDTIRVRIRPRGGNSASTGRKPRNGDTIRVRTRPHGGDSASTGREPRNGDSIRVRIRPRGGNSASTGRKPRNGDSIRVRTRPHGGDSASTGREQADKHESINQSFDDVVFMRVPPPRRPRSPPPMEILPDTAHFSCEVNELHGALHL